jgi:hypothetical protein
MERTNVLTNDGGSLVAITRVSVATQTARREILAKRPGVEISHFVVLLWQRSHWSYAVWIDMSRLIEDSEQRNERKDTATSHIKILSKLMHSVAQKNSA